MLITQATNEHIQKLILARSVSSLKYHYLLNKYKTAHSALEHINYKANIATELKLIEEQKIELIFHGEADYPQALNQLLDAPAVLSIKGKRELLNRPAIAIVGSRQATLPSRAFAKQIAHELGLSGQIIISGVAAGIDTQAHYASLHTGTIGVLGCGLNVIYPLENEALYKEIIKYGLLISEFGINNTVRKESFPQRNRIIAGLCWGCIVIEASLKSGSLITAQYALEQGKELFSVPGHPMDINSKGCNALIKEGAILTECAKDVLDHYNNTTRKTPRYIDFEQELDETASTTLSDRILTLISTTGSSISSIHSVLQCDIHILRSALIELELANKIYISQNDQIFLHI